MLSLCRRRFPGEIQIPNLLLSFVGLKAFEFIHICLLNAWVSEGSGVHLSPVWLKINLGLDLGLGRSLLSKTLEPTKKAKGHRSDCISFVAQCVNTSIQKINFEE